MLGDKMTAAINGQINAELYSAYLYLAMSAYAGHAGFKGAASWLHAQAVEETTHAERFANYLGSQGARLLLEAIDKPPADFASLADVFQKVLEHEQKVTSLIDNLVETARAEKDHASEIMLQWFVSEQVEEEENVNEILDQIKLAGDSGGALFMIDRQLGARSAAAAPSEQS